MVRDYRRQRTDCVSSVSLNSGNVVDARSAIFRLINASLGWARQGNTRQAISHSDVRQ